jgi:hypothetical protein
MTGAEMLYEWELGFDVIASNAAPGFTSTEKYALLNRGQDYIILDFYKQKDFVSLQSLLVNSNVTISSSTRYSSGILPANYWLLNKVNVKVTRSALTNTGFIPSHTNVDVYLECEEIDFKNSYKYFTSSFNNFRFWKEPKFYLSNKTIYIIPDDYTTLSTTAILFYIRKRLDISASQSCELQESFHRLVVDKAIDIAKTIINVQEPQSTQNK